MKQKVVYSWNVFAENRGVDGIWLHKGLQKFPKLMNQVLQHERQHTGHLSWRDVKLDIFSNTNPCFLLLCRFFLRYPMAFFWYLLPFSFNVEKRKVYFDYERCFTYLVMAYGYAVIIWAVTRQLAG